MTEEFRDIEGYKDYQVSNLGRVKSFKRNGRILKGSVDGGGYKTVFLYKKGKQKTIKVHQLVSIAFLGHKLNNNGLVVDHKNNIKSDNRLENLQVFSHRENSSKDRRGYSSKYIGVSWKKANNKWQASICIKDKRKFLGYFTDELEAHNKYQKALKQL